MVEEAPEAEEEDFEAVVAGANGTVGRFRSGGDFPDARAAGSHGEVSSTELDAKRLRSVLPISLIRRFLNDTEETDWQSVWHALNLQTRKEGSRYCPDSPQVFSCSGRLQFCF